MLILRYDVYKEIIATARKRKAELICSASHGRYRVSANVIGSVTDKVLTHSKISLLVIR